MKQSGLGDRLYIGGYDLSGDIGSLGRIGGGPALGENTGINKSAIERIGLLRDGAFQYSSWFNDAAGQQHAVLSALPTTDVQHLYCRGSAAGAPAAAVLAKQSNYDGSRGSDGSLSFGVDAMGNGFALEWGRLLTAAAHDSTGAENLTGVDFGAAGTNGLQAYLQVTEFTGTDATVTIEQSSDDGSGDAYASLVAFSQITSGPTVERITQAGAVEQWLRIAISTSGGFTSMSLVVAAVHNEVAVSF